MTFKEIEHLDFNPLFIGIVMWWDSMIWMIVEMQKAHNALHKDDK